MGFSGFISFVASLIFIVLTLETSLMADPRTRTAAHRCSSSTALSTSIYRDNFVSTMTNLSDLVNQDCFGTAVTGEGANAVFGLAQCYNDLNSSDCALCFSKIRSVLPTCYGKGGRLFLDGCFGRYENYSFFEQSIDDFSVNNCSYSKMNNSNDVVKFDETVRKVVGNVSLKAQQNKGFALESSVGWSSFGVYALAQCWDSLNEKACNSCLQVAATSIVSCSPATEGRSLNAGCYMRYSTEMFWNSDYNTDHNSTGKNRHIWIILFSTIIALVLLIGIYLWKGQYLLFRLYRKYWKGLDGSGLSSVLSQSNFFKYRDMKRATNGFDKSNKVGQGSFGAVYKGTLPNGEEVAVKRLFLNIREWIDQFVNEVQLVNQLRHKNLVKLLGCSVDGLESLLVFEYCANKSLDHFLFDKKQAKFLDWKKRIEIIAGVAEGLSYLHHGSEIRIIHRDVKASNILLNDKFKPKITDFGLARSFTEDQTHLSTGIAGTLGYMAPEYAIHGHLTEKADVYSFGILTLEVVTGQRCTSDPGTEPGQNLLAKVWSSYKSKTMERMIDESIYKEATKDEILSVVRVGLLCTQATPSYRPTMAKVVELLTSQRHQDNVSPIDPPFLDFYSAAAGDGREDEAFHVISLDSGPSRSGSSGSLIYGR